MTPVASLRVPSDRISLPAARRRSILEDVDGAAVDEIALRVAERGRWRSAPHRQTKPEPEGSVRAGKPPGPDAASSFSLRGQQNGRCPIL